MKELNLTNPHQVPRISAVVVTVGVGKQRDNASYMKAVAQDLAVITGQQPRQRVARKAVSGFNVREGNVVGYQVTLRGKRRDEFVQRFINVTLPRVRDFRGIAPYAMDGHGNISVGLTEHLAFPEIQADKTDVIFGVQVTFVTTATTNRDGEVLLRALGFPFNSETARSAETAGVKRETYKRS